MCAGDIKVDATASFCCVLRLRLGEHSILMGAEMDGFDPACAKQGNTPTLDSFLELKTTKCAMIPTAIVF